ncbi:hypothetical protein BDV25DRAFT_162230 [Aspergillus avenaceus]|uniref:Fungal-specific transcription factor domain-containing protein n=1 Tax=Aspergillus avenaceus TaxID=36643 RepID=A0A5N6TJR2_ASPAV|nr:hypothetical protein BDV25DRAFT_162230 [Aspergillus avenaceus]
MSERSCEYADIFRNVARSRTSAPSTSSPAGSKAKDAPPSDAANANSSSHPEDPPVNMLHIRLIHHFMTEIRALFSDTVGTSMLLPGVMDACLSSPYVMNEALALSALHMSITRPAERDFYRHHAAQLQTHALTMLNSMDLQLNQETCVPLFLFSGVLNMHILCDALTFRDNDDFEQFLDHLARGFRLCHGIRAITGSSWVMLRESALKPIILDGEAQFESRSKLSHPESAKLLESIEKAKLGPSLTATYRKAIEALQAAVHIHSHENVGDSISKITAWPVLMPPEYIDLLMPRRPEALVVLTHYAVSLHFRRDIWVFGDGGRFLIESINQYLGPGWAEWLEWPMRVLNETGR